MGKSAKRVSLKAALSSQQSRLKKKQEAAHAAQHAERAKAGGTKGKGKEKDGVDDEEGSDEEMDEEEEETWKVEVQARFIRALHELDYMGFVKHTGRKPDHVIRTIYDIPD